MRTFVFTFLKQLPNDFKQIEATTNNDDETNLENDERFLTDNSTLNSPL